MTPSSPMARAQQVLTWATAVYGVLFLLYVLAATPARAQVQCEDERGEFFIMSLHEYRGERSRVCLDVGTYDRLHRPPTPPAPVDRPRTPPAATPANTDQALFDDCMDIGRRVAPSGRLSRFCQVQVENYAALRTNRALRSTFCEGWDSECTEMMRAGGETAMPCLFLAPRLCR